MSTPSTGHRAWQYNFAFLDEHTKGSAEQIP